MRVIFDIADQAHIGGPFKANWAKGESIKASKSCRGFLRRHLNIYDKFCRS